MIMMSRVPTTINSARTYTLNTLKSTLSGGHPLSTNSLHVCGDSTSVSHSATVSVHTKKYLCADRCGGRSSEGGSCSVVFVAMAGGQLEEPEQSSLVFRLSSDFSEYFSSLVGGTCDWPAT